MATYTKFNQFIEDLFHGVHDLSTDQVVVALTNTAPSAGMTILSNITEISYTNLLSNPTSRNITISTSEGSDGSYEAIMTDKVLTASGGSFGPFRYVVLYNDTPTTPLNPLISYFDYGSAVTVNNGETFTLDFGANTITAT